MLPKRRTKSKLDDEINRALDTLKTLQDDPEKYSAKLEHIAKLHKMKTEEGPKSVSLDTVLLVSANIAGILWITAVEREHPLATKALNYMIKPR